MADGRDPLTEADLALYEDLGARWTESNLGPILARRGFVAMSAEIRRLAAGLAAVREELKKEKLQHLDVLKDIRQILVALDRYRALAPVAVDGGAGETDG